VPAPRSGLPRARLVKTTSIHLASGEDRQEHVVRLRERGRPTLDDDREAA
jgi:hypothetical protein